MREIGFGAGLGAAFFGSALCAWVCTADATGDPNVQWRDICRSVGHVTRAHSFCVRDAVRGAAVRQAEQQLRTWVAQAVHAVEASGQRQTTQQLKKRPATNGRDPLEPAARQLAQSISTQPDPATRRDWFAALASATERQNGTNGALSASDRLLRRTHDLVQQFSRRSMLKLAVGGVALGLGQSLGLGGTGGKRIIASTARPDHRYYTILDTWFGGTNALKEIQRGVAPDDAVGQAAFQALNEGLHAQLDPAKTAVMWEYPSHHFTSLDQLAPRHLSVVVGAKDAMFGHLDRFNQLFAHAPTETREAWIALPRAQQVAMAKDVVSGHRSLLQRRVNRTDENIAALNSRIARMEAGGMGAMHPHQQRVDALVDAQQKLKNLSCVVPWIAELKERPLWGPAAQPAEE